MMDWLTDLEQCFQFLGIPPKGERDSRRDGWLVLEGFQFLGIPPKGEPLQPTRQGSHRGMFPISRDPPEGGTTTIQLIPNCLLRKFPISRDPPEGGTVRLV